MKNGKLKIENLVKIFCAACVLSVGIFAQTSPPEPSAPKSVKIPAVKETKLKNGLRVAVVERKNVPLITVQLLIMAGAENEDSEVAGLADMTASLLTKGTKTRSATQIAEQMEFLGGSINSVAGWNSSFISVNVMTDKADQAMTILSDAVLNPAFKQDEIDLLKSQTLDGLSYNLTQPGFLGNYVASVYSFNEHPAGGTPESIKRIDGKTISTFYKVNYIPANALLIFTGDITNAKAEELANKYFGKWTAPKTKNVYKLIESRTMPPKKKDEKQMIAKRLLIVDLPNSGQASVVYTKTVAEGRASVDSSRKVMPSSIYYPALTLNSVLGGGYSSRLNQEIRIKRGLSYGAGSGFAWRFGNANFSTRTQTKNESAAEVVSLVLDEIKKLSETKVENAELVPRKSVLTGNFGRNLETNAGLAAQIADLYSFGLSANELNSYMNSVEAVSDSQIQNFSKSNLYGGDVIIVGDYAKFKDDLAKRFPDMKVEVIKADQLDITKENLRKAN